MILRLTTTAMILRLRATATCDLLQHCCDLQIPFHQRTLPQHKGQANHHHLTQSIIPASPSPSPSTDCLYSKREAIEVNNGRHARKK